jgi:hypothetical protein
MTKIRREFSKRLNKKENKIIPLPAIIGDGAGNLFDDDGNVYVRVNDQVQTIKSSNVSLAYGLPVWVGYEPTQPGTFKILNEKITDADSITNSIPSAHANTHEWMGPGSNGGSDVVKVQLPQFMPLRVMPYGAFSVIVWPNVIPIASGYILIADTNDLGMPVPKVLDLSTYAAAVSADKAVYLLVTIDTAGDIVITVGSEVDTADLALSDIPAQPADTLYKLAAIRLYYGQSAVLVNRITTDIIDLRFPMAHTHPVSELGEITWYDVTGKPAVFTPDTHTHVEADITDLSHNAASIDGVAVDTNSITDGQALLYNLASQKLIPGDVGSGTSDSGITGDCFWFMDGALSVVINAGAQFIIARTGTISAVGLACKDLGSIGNTVVDVNLNGTTIFTTQDNRPSLAYDNADGVIISVTPDIVDIVEGDLLSFDIDSAATGAEGLSVLIAIDYAGGSGSGEVPSALKIILSKNFI